MWCGIAILGAVLMAQETPVIRVPVRMVAVPTLVFSKDNGLIPGLKKADFRVLDNGIPQSIHLDTHVRRVPGHRSPHAAQIARHRHMSARPRTGRVARWPPHR